MSKQRYRDDTEAILFKESPSRSGLRDQRANAIETASAQRSSDRDGDNQTPSIFEVMVAFIQRKDERSCRYLNSMLMNNVKALQTRINPAKSPPKYVSRGTNRHHRI